MSLKGEESMRRRGGIARWRSGLVAALLISLGIYMAACGGADQASNTTSSSTARDRTASQAWPGGTRPSMMGTTTTVTASESQGQRDTSGSLAQPQTSTPSTQQPTSTSAQSTTTTLAKGSYGDGTYLVGSDIDSGLYKGTTWRPGAHWEISWDANGEKFVAAGDPVGQFYVKISSGQYLRLEGVTIAKASTTAAETLLDSNIGEGTYRVGYDIAAGWYKGVTNGSLGYWEITSDANGRTVVASDYVKGTFTLKVKSGQYLTLRGVTVSQ